MIVGIVGSPRKNKLTNRLVDAVLEGSKLENADVEKVYLIDFDVKPYTGVQGSCPEDLNRLCEEADAIVLGSPVYWGDISGLTKSFMETVNIPSADGKPALGISIAGGTGKGLLSGIQSIYHFFFHKRMRAINPTPVSRFNLEVAARELVASGRKLVLLSREKKPFQNLIEVSRYYQSLPFLDCDILDEFMLLTAQLLKVSESNRVEDARKDYEKAKSLVQRGERVEAVAYSVRAYESLYFKAE